MIINQTNNLNRVGLKLNRGEPTYIVFRDPAFKKGVPMIRKVQGHGGSTVLVQYRKYHQFPIQDQEILGVYDTHYSALQAIRRGEI